MSVATIRPRFAIVRGQRQRLAARPRAQVDDGLAGPRARRRARAAGCPRPAPRSARFASAAVSSTRLPSGRRRPSGACGVGTASGNATQRLVARALSVLTRTSSGARSSSAGNFVCRRSRIEPRRQPGRRDADARRPVRPLRSAAAAVRRAVERGGDRRVVPRQRRASPRAARRRARRLRRIAR